jgi:triacylglycerol lipase
VRILFYTPPASSAALKPAYLHIHGGGYVMGGPIMGDGTNRILSERLGCVVVSVDYRLAPETAFPGGLEDCYAALAWLHKEAEALGVDRARIAVGGESAGGGHAAALAQYARDKEEYAICLQVLDCPMLDDRTGSTTAAHANGVYVWTPESNAYGWRSYLGTAPGGPDTPKYASPARMDDLSGLAPAYVAIGALDMFLEESLDYARRLICAGVPTEMHVIPGVFHGGTFGDSPQAKQYFQLLRDALGKAFAQGGNL